MREHVVGAGKELSGIMLLPHERTEGKVNPVDVLCVGINVVDITAMPVGKSEDWLEKQRISDIRIQIGGDAANQALRLADLGLHAASAGAVGADQNGDFLKNSLEMRGVNTDFLVQKSDVCTGTSLVLVDAEGERHTFSVRGAHSCLTRADVERTLKEDVRAVSLASLFSIPILEKDGLFEYLSGMRKKGALIFGDLSSDKEKAGLDGIRLFLPLIDYFLPSLYDAAGMTGTKTAEDAAKVYHENGASQVVVKCGAKGCYYSSEKDGRSGHVPAVSVRPLDTTGAGDCMNALFISRILAGDDMETACRYACAGASCSTLFFGANGGRLTPEYLEKWMKEHC